MTQTVTLPVWLLAILVLFAAWAVLDRLLLPGMRWYFRRRINLVIDEINTLPFFTPLYVRRPSSWVPYLNQLAR